MKSRIIILFIIFGFVTFYVNDAPAENGNLHLTEMVKIAANRAGFNVRPNSIST